jgi:hypothetical protein
LYSRQLMAMGEILLSDFRGYPAGRPVADAARSMAARLRWFNRRAPGFH